MPRSVSTAPVPDIDGLRRAALQASWRRDRRVAQRRMAMRWIAWYAVRGLPLLAIAAAVWLWVLPKLSESAPTPANTPARQTGPVPSAPLAPARAAAPVAAALKPATPDSPRSEPGLQLKLESPFQSAVPGVGTQTARVQTAGKATSATDSPSPQLKPDNWLHSQEP